MNNFAPNPGEFVQKSGIVSLYTENAENFSFLLLQIQIIQTCFRCRTPSLPLSPLPPLIYFKNFNHINDGKHAVML